MKTEPSEKNPLSVSEATNSSENFKNSKEKKEEKEREKRKEKEKRKETLGFSQSEPSDKNLIRELIKRVREGDQDAFSVLLNQYRPLIESLVTRFGGPFGMSFGGPMEEESPVLQREDLKQEAIVVFYNSILSYDIEQTEVEFGLYAKICIRNALVSLLRAQKRHVSEVLTGSFDMDSVSMGGAGDVTHSFNASHAIYLADVIGRMNTFDHDSEDPSVRILEQERIKNLYSVIRKNLSNFEYRVWQLYMSGRTAAEIGRMVGKDEKSINNAIYRIRRKLRALLR